MKKKFLISFIFVLISFSINVFAYTENSVSNVVRYSDTVEMNAQSAPTLRIRISDDPDENFSFSVILNQAQWNSNFYYESGILCNSHGASINGITYQRLGDSRLLFNVDIEEFNTQQDINIPLAVKFTTGGDIFVEVKSDGSIVSDGTYHFATVGTTELKIECDSNSNIYESGEIGNIIITDNSFNTIKGGTEYTLKLTNGFKFHNVPKYTTEGKYLGNISLWLDQNDSSTLNIRVDANSPSEKGVIKLVNPNIEKTSSSIFGKIELKFSVKNSGTTISVGEYKKRIDQSVALSIDEIDVYNTNPEFKGKGIEGQTITLNVDGYKVGTSVIDENNNWSIDYSKSDRNPLKTGKHTVDVSYYRKSTDTLYDDSIIKMDFFTINRETTMEVIYTINSNIMNYDYKDYEIEGTPYISDEGITMLPLRALAYSLKVNSDNIHWVDESKSVTIKIGTTEIRADVGTDILLVNGQKVKMDTKTVLNSDGRVYLPMRSILNAFGITDGNIIWNGETKTVKILRPR